MPLGPEVLCAFLASMAWKPPLEEQDENPQSYHKCHSSYMQNKSHTASCGCIPPFPPPQGNPVRTGAMVLGGGESQPLLYHKQQHTFSQKPRQGKSTHTFPWLM
jgi:hypothetical protein